jgi:heme/copper-type cytochrome/quinol oxidase subunit 3
VLGARLHRSAAAGVPAPDVRNLARYRLRPSEDEVTSYVGMVIFLGSWAMMFAALFFAYAVVRVRAPAWPPPDQPSLPILLPGVNTAVIAASSAAVALAVRALALGRHRRASMALGAGAALGALFLALQAVVWVGVWRAGLVPTGGPYPSVFYALTTFHALHVLVGLAALVVLAVCARAPRRVSRSAVRLWGMFWHFVGAIWGALYVAVYLT